MRLCFFIKSNNILNWKFPVKFHSCRGLNNAVHTCAPNRKTRTENFRYENVYRYTPILQENVKDAVVLKAIKKLITKKIRKR